VSRRGRIVGFGSCGVLVVIGVVCAVVVPGGTGQVLTLVFIALGLTCATSLVFLELGLSEDRERAREEAARRRRSRLFRRPLRSPRQRLGRARDHPRRLD
jgi:hypothetical protein